MLNTDRIKARLDELNMTQADLAAVISVAVPTMCQKINNVLWMRPKKSQRRFKFPMLSLDHIFLARKLHSAILGCNLWFKQPPAGPGEERGI